MQPSNIFFSKLIKLEGRLREFNFRKIPKLENSFHIDVTDDYGRRIMFRMVEEENVCDYNVPVESLPRWLSTAVPHLSTAIKEAGAA